MVPVRCLDIRPHHLVLDLCASPGSKTGQVLEALHSSPGLPRGCVLANEFSLRRSTNLYGNMREFQSPCLAVTQHPAQAFPDLILSGGEKVQYDHIVCDVPCSGDGTIRYYIISTTFSARSFYFKYFLCYQEEPEHLVQLASSPGEQQVQPPVEHR